VSNKPSCSGSHPTKGTVAEENGTASSASDASAGAAFHQLPAPRRSRLVCATLTDAERAQLLDWTRSRTLPHRLVIRSHIILLAAEGLTVQEIADRLRVGTATVRLWCTRFNAAGVTALAHDRPGRGRPPGRSTATVIATLQAMRTRAEREPRWTTRTLAAAVGTSAASVWRIWRHYRVGPGSTTAEIERAIARAIIESTAASK
jgi:transposase